MAQLPPREGRQQGAPGMPVTVGELGAAMTAREKSRRQALMRCVLLITVEPLCYGSVGVGVGVGSTATDGPIGLCPGGGRRIQGPVASLALQGPVDQLSLSPATLRENTPIQSRGGSDVAAASPVPSSALSTIAAVSPATALEARALCALSDRQAGAHSSPAPSVLQPHRPAERSLASSIIRHRSHWTGQPVVPATRDAKSSPATRDFGPTFTGSAAEPSRSALQSVGAAARAPTSPVRAYPRAKRASPHQS